MTAWSIRLITATAAAVVLSLALHALRTSPMAVAAGESVVPGLTDMSTRAYLQRMDVMPDASATQQYLMVDTSPTNARL